MLEIVLERAHVVSEDGTVAGHPVTVISGANPIDKQIDALG